MADLFWGSTTLVNAIAAESAQPSSSAGTAVTAASLASTSSSDDCIYVLRVLLSTGAPTPSPRPPLAGGSFLVAACSDGTVRSYDVGIEAGMPLRPRFSVRVADGKKTTIRDMALRETPTSPPTILVALDMGSIHALDAATGAELMKWKLPNTIKKPSRKIDDADYGIYAIAVNSPCGDVVAVSCVSQLLFYSLKTNPPRLLGSYADVHTEAVTQLIFHPSFPHHIASAGDDGLLCLVDTSIKGEDEAIVTVCNAESSIAHFGFFGPAESPHSFAWVCTRTLTLSLWNLETGEQLARFDNLLEVFTDANLFICELMGCRYRAADSASTSLGPHLELFTSDGDGQMYVWRISPPPQGLMGAGEATLVYSSSSSAGGAGGASAAAPASASTSTAGSFKRGGANGFTIAPAYQLQAGAHASCARNIEWASLLRRSPAEHAHCGDVAFTAGEDGRIVFWADAKAGTAITAAAAASTATATSAVAAPPPSGDLFFGSQRGQWYSAALASRAGLRDDSDAFGTRDTKRPVSPPQTNGSGTAAAAFLFGEDNAGDGSAVDAAVGAKIQEAAERAAMDEDAPLAAAGAGSSMMSEVRRAREKGKLNPFAPAFKQQNH